LGRKVRGKAGHRREIEMIDRPSTANVKRKGTVINAPNAVPGRTDTPHLAFGTRIILWINALPAPCPPDAIRDSFAARR